jgi:hypothetical protein
MQEEYRRQDTRRQKWYHTEPAEHAEFFRQDQPATGTAGKQDRQKLSSVFPEESQKGF